MATHPLLLAHREDPARDLRRATAADPLRVLVSGCLAGWGCGIDGTDYGMGGALGELAALPALVAVPFCPEQVALGVPRGMPDCHGGDGFDVLAGRARVLDEAGADLTEAMVHGAEAMVASAREHRVELAILTDMSAACGSQVISLGCRLVENRAYQVGVGVAAASLLEAGIPVVSQRDHRTLARIRTHLDSSFEADPGLVDHHQTPWYRGAFPR